MRAAMVDDPAHYRWSSYRTNGLGQVDSSLTPHVQIAGDILMIAVGTGMVVDAIEDILR